MGRFETAAEFYRFREPYPPAFFETVVARLGLAPEIRMLDIACGPGNLAIGFAPYIGSCVAVDREPEMLRVARETAAGNTKVEFIEAAIEDLHPAPGEFHLATIGRAIHWLPRERTLDYLTAALAPAAPVAVCSATTADTTEWIDSFRKLRREWAPDFDEKHYRPDLDEWFAGSRFQKRHEIVVNSEHFITIEDLVGRALSFSVTAPAVLGDRRPDFERAVRALGTEYATEGLLREDLVAKAVVFG